MVSTTVQFSKTPQVVVAYLDGWPVRGHVSDFSPLCEECLSTKDGDTY